MKQKTRKMLSALAAVCVTMTAVSGMLPAQSDAPKASAAAQVLAFPGAVGGGKYATGGRGGEVYHVTNLNDSGAGSLRDAVSKSNRIVVFDISGTIELKGNILCSSNVTIAGQTAPGGSGVTLKNYKFGMSGDNIICRFLSSRPGPYASTSSGNDAWGGAKGSGSIIDHCSMGWTTDEQWGLYSANEYYTVQYSVLGPADSWGGHSKGLHGFGIMMGKGNLTFDHNLIIHNVSRNFRGKVDGQKTADFTNNIIYDWAYQTTYGTIGHLNYVNNTLKAGNSTTGGYHWMYVDSTTKPQNFKVYCAGNQMLMQDGSQNAITFDNWAGVTLKDSIGITKDDLYSGSAFATTFNGENVSTAMTAESAEASYQHVIDFAGNGIAPKLRTAIDQQCAAETANGTGSCSGTAAYDASEPNLDKYHIQCGVTYKYPDAVLQKTITDADNDGMDDAWELARGLNPNDPTDINGDYCGLGYTNIEYYINDLTVDAFPPGVVELSPAQAVDPISAFETIEAEDFDAQEGVQTEALASGGQNIGYVENGDYIMFRTVDFGTGAKSFTANLSGNPANIELYLDGIAGTPASTVRFAGTNGFSDYQELTWNLTKTLTGTHNLYLRFTGGEGYLLNMNSFVFGRDAIPVNGRLAGDLQVEAGAYPESWYIADDVQVGARLFGDRDVTFITLPAVLEGAEQIVTACDAKNSTGDLASFTALADCSVYVLLDTRVEDAGNTPDWLSSYERLPETAENSGNPAVSFALYKMDVSAGTPVTLGNNNMTGNCVNYTVMLQKTTPVETTATVMQTTTTTAVTTTASESAETTTTTTAADVPDENVRWGDANCDGSVDVADAVLMSRYAASDTTAVISGTGMLQADVTHDGFVAADDCALVLQYVAKLLTADDLKP